ncbi:membrane protein [Escherichia coli]|uniref:Membrane protein n=1 Tax=Escherichia coli TaxID=562 RepID=A0A377E1R9_ECOLX|nr:membrane protein [Escherichia coli]
MKSTLLSESILSDANNLTIMRSVRMYNNMVRRISDWNDLELEGIYPESVYGLLDKVDTILGKILNIIFSKKITSSQDLAFILKNNEILTRSELNDSLTGILVNCPLLACVRDIESLIKYLRCPGRK